MTQKKRKVGSTNFSKNETLAERSNGGKVESELFSNGVKAVIIPFAIFAAWYILEKITDWLSDKIDYMCAN